MFWRNDKKSVKQEKKLKNKNKNSLRLWNVGKRAGLTTSTMMRRFLIWQVNAVVSSIWVCRVKLTVVRSMSCQIKTLTPLYCLVCLPFSPRFWVAVLTSLLPLRLFRDARAITDFYPGKSSSKFSRPVN